MRTLLIISIICLIADVRPEPCRKLGKNIMSCIRAKPEDIPKEPDAAVTWVVLKNSDFPTLKKQTFKNYKGLTDIHAENNNVATVEPDSFVGLTLLDWVDLAENKITNIDPNIFKTNTKINHFNISFNPLSIPENKPFLIAPSLRWLILKNCNIKKLYKETFTNLEGLRNLDLSDNQIATIPNDLFVNQRLLSYLPLNNNKLTHLSKDVFKNGLTMIVHLSDNPWTCDCELYKVIQWTKKNLLKDNPKCTGPPALANKSWKEITNMQCPAAA